MSPSACGEAVAVRRLLVFAMLVDWAAQFGHSRVPATFGDSRIACGVKGLGRGGSAAGVGPATRRENTGNVGGPGPHA
jgi:hypothetical protein